MNLYCKMLAVALLPLLLAFGYSVYALNHMVNEDKISAQRNYALETRLVEQRLRNVSSLLSMSADTLARSSEVAAMMRAGDVDGLYRWGKSFLGNDVDKLFFLDINGLVLARAHDEIIFGDSLGELSAFTGGLMHGAYMGTSRLEGEECLFYSKVVRQYGENPVGVIVAAVVIDMPLLTEVIGGTGAVVSYESPTLAALHTGTTDGADYVTVCDLRSDDAQQGGVFSIYFREDASFVRLKRFRENVMKASVGIFLLLPLLVFAIVRYHLQPFAFLSLTLERFASGRILSNQLRTQLSRLCTSRKSEVGMVAEAVISFSAATDESIRDLVEKNAQLARVNKTDSLTQLANRSHLYSTLEYEINRARRYATPLVIAMIDLDHFKDVNDSYGHVTGDAVLVEFARLLCAEKRDADVAGRWGGEEFLVILPGVEIEGACVWAERVCSACSNRQFGLDRRVTCSIGLSTLSSDMQLEAFVGAADKALYRAKGKGRNRVEPECSVLSGSGTS